MTAISTYDANFADSSQVTAERGEAEALAAQLQEALAQVEKALSKDRARAPTGPASAAASRSRRPSRGTAGDALLHRLRLGSPLSTRARWRSLTV